MSDKTDIIFSDQSGWKRRTLFVGGLLGLIVGVASAFLYVQSASQRVDGTKPGAPSVGEAVRVGSVLIGVVRTITDWASR